MSVKLTPIHIDDDTVIYIEVTEDVKVTSTTLTDNEEQSPVTRGLREDFKTNFQDFQSTIFTYTSYTLAAFKKVAVAEISKVTLEFGLEIGGEMGVPYITKGTAKSNLKVTVECNLTDKTKPDE